MKVKPIQLSYMCSGTLLSKRVTAEVVGDWAVHLIRDIEPWSGCHGYRVTHVPTGMCIARAADDMTHSDALTVAYSLEDSGVRPSDPDFRHVAQAAVAQSLGESP